MIRKYGFQEAICMAAKGTHVIGLEMETSSIVDVTKALQELERLRFLIDEDMRDGQEDDTEIWEALEQEKKEKKEKKEKPKGGNIGVEEMKKREQEILQAWNRGERTIKEIMEITGYSYGTVTKYIPRTAEG